MIVTTLEDACSFLDGGARAYASLKEQLAAIYAAVKNRVEGRTAKIEIPWAAVKAAHTDLVAIKTRLEDLDDPPHRVLGMLREAQRRLLAFMARPALFQRSMDQDRQSVAKYQDNPYIAGQAATKAVTTLGLQRSLKPAPVLAGDSLHSLATRYHADWREIVQVNRLEYPYVDGTQTTSGAPSLPTSKWVAKRGDYVQIPGYASRKQRSQAMGASADLGSWTGAQDVAERRLFGGDLALDFDAKALVLDEATGDLQVVAGRDNLEQSLNIGFKIAFGSLRLYPTVGSWLHAEFKANKWSGPLAPRVYAHAAKKDILGNPRVARVSRIEAGVDQGGVTVKFEGQAIDGSSLGTVTI